MPFYNEPLLSVWPNDLFYTVGRKPAEIPPEILAIVKRVDNNIEYAPNLGFLQRNQQNYRRKSDPKDDVPKFRSEQERENPSVAATSAAAAAAAARQEKAVIKREEFRREASYGISIPKSYRKVEIKYSRFGVEDFDFAFYNKTRFGGLETHISNSYSNALLQVWNFNKPIKKLTLRHLASNCSNKLCIICELGFLFSMLSCYIILNNCI